MLGSIALIAGVIFLFIVPIMTLVRYYSASQFTVLGNLMWIVITLVTWPLIPMVLAAKHHDKRLLTYYWLSFLGFAVAGGYWLALNLEQITQVSTGFMMS